MSNEKSYNRITVSIATALMIVLTVSLGFQFAQPALAQSAGEQAGDAAQQAGQAAQQAGQEAGQAAQQAGQEMGEAAQNATGNQTGNQSGGPLEQLGQMLGFGGGN
jgi:hypothetical protein